MITLITPKDEIPKQITKSIFLAGPTLRKETKNDAVGMQTGIVNSGIRCCTLRNARFFHFWSRTIYQETGGSNPHFFENNRQYYVTKWGGDFGSELYQAPTLIDSREGELEKILHWKSR